MAQAPKEDKSGPAIGGIPLPPAAGEIAGARAATKNRGALAHLLARPVTGEATVTVACKHPSGFRLQLHERSMSREPVMGGGFKEVPVWRQTGDEVFIRGTSHPEGSAPFSEMSGGYALSPGVSQAFWEKWLEQNKDWGPVRQGLIFAHESKAMVVDGAKANAARVTGLERLDPNKLPEGIERVPAEAKAA